jgi:hypothetical protein
MKSIIFVFFSALCFSLLGQQTIQLGQDVMGSFASSKSECYSLPINQPGNYLLKYNLWDATIALLDPDSVNVFSDYMATMDESFREKQLTLQDTGSYQLCFSTSGMVAMYQGRIDLVDSSYYEPIPLQYGDVVNEISSERTTYSYIFNGSEGEKVRIGFSLLFGSLIITDPNGSELFNQSYESTPDNGEILELTLETSGEYQIEIKAEMSFLQFMLGLHLLDVTQAVPIEKNNTLSNELPAWAVQYYSFTVNADEKIQLNYTGSTTGITIHMIMPGGQVIECNELMEDVRIIHNVVVEDEGEVIVAINSSISGSTRYDLFIDQEQTQIPVEPYDLGTLIIKDIKRLDKQKYSFEGKENETLRIALSLLSAAYTLEDPDNEIIYNADYTSPFSYKLELFDKVELEKTGQYILTIWHNSANEDLLEMKFCASITGDPELMEMDSVYQVGIPPYQELEYGFNAGKNDLVRLGFPVYSTMITPAGDSITINPGDFFTLEQNGVHTIGLSNYLTDTANVEIWVNAVIPPDSAVPVEIGEIYEDFIEGYETKSIVFEGNAGDTVFIQGDITEVILSPSVNNLKSTACYLYITDPGGKQTILKGQPRGIEYELGYGISSYFKKQLIMEHDGAYILTAFIDKMVFLNPTMITLRVDQNGGLIELPFGTYSDYEVPGVYCCKVPDQLDELYVIVKKSNYIGYDATWRGSASLEHGDETWETTGYLDERDDFIFYLSNPDSGLYLLPISSNMDDEIRGSILFTDNLPKAKLNQWTSGIITRPYGSDWKMLEINEDVDTLYFETEGFGLWSTIEITYGHLSNSDERWIFQNMGEGYHIKGKIPHAKAGRYFIRYVDSAVLQDKGEGLYNHSEDQTKTYMLYCGISQLSSSDLLTVKNLSSHELGTAEASFKIYGTGFLESSIVYLINEDLNDTLSINTWNVADDGRELTAGYDFSTVEPGIYNLELVNPDTLVRYARPLEVIPVVTISVTSSMLTSDLYRLGRNQKCIVRITNNGTADIPFAAGYFYTSSDKVQTLITDTPYMEYSADSMNMAMQEKIFQEQPFFIENLQVGDEAEFIFNIYSSTFPGNEIFYVGYKVAVLDEEDYYAIQDTMATAWYHFIINEPTYPQSLKYYLSELGLEGFIDLWNRNGEGELKSGTEETNEQKIERFENGAKKYIWVFDKAVDKALPFSSPFGDSDHLLNIISNPYSVLKKGIEVVWDKAKYVSRALDGITSMLFGSDSEEKEKKAVNSTTPEDKYGPTGHGMGNGIGYIDSLEVFEYRIDYWNKEDASAPAAMVYIRDTIDTNFDLTSVKFTEIGFLKWEVELDGGQYFNVNVDCRPEMPYIVNVEGTVDYESRELYWVHTTLDPETMELPEDPMAGYLPAIDSTGYQMGWVNFTIRPQKNLPDGTSFQNQAFVNFDGIGKWGPAPPYGPYTNIYDFSAPDSYVEMLDPVQNQLTFDMNLHGMDFGSGIKSFDVYISKDYAEFELYATLEDTVFSFTGEDGSYYQFYSIATDKVGNKEGQKSVYEAFTTINLNETEVEMIKQIQNCKIKIIPNPSMGNFRIELENGSVEKAVVEIIHLSGEKIYQKDYLTGNQINLQHLPKGLYIVGFKSRKGTYYSKLNIY